MIILGQVPLAINSPTARLLLDTYNYLLWPVATDTHADSNHDGESTDGGDTQPNKTHRQKLFWAKLVRHLYGNTASCMCCLPMVGPKSIGYREVREIANDGSVDVP